MTTEREALDALKTTDQQLVELLMDRSILERQRLAAAYARIEELEATPTTISYGAGLVEVAVNGRHLGWGNLTVTTGGGLTSFDFTVEEGS